MNKAEREYKEAWDKYIETKRAFLKEIVKAIEGMYKSIRKGN